MEAAANATKTCALAVWSLVLGVLSLLCFGLFTGIPAVICGHVAQGRIRRSAGELGGEGFAIGGLITGYIGTVLTTIALLGVVAAIMLPALAGARGGARKAQCRNNLSQIAICSRQYALVNDGKYPPNFRALSEFVEDPSNPRMFVCPSTGKQPGSFATVDQWSDYVLVPNRSMDDEPDTILAFTKPECYPGKGGHVLTVDGAVQWFDLREYERLTAEFRR